MESFFVFVFVPCLVCVGYMALESGGIFKRRGN